MPDIIGSISPKKNIQGTANTGANINLNKEYFIKFCKQLSVVWVNILITPSID